MVDQPTTTQPTVTEQTTQTQPSPGAEQTSSQQTSTTTTTQAPKAETETTTLLGAEPPKEPGKDAPKPEGAPESYTEFTAPEGYEIDATALAEFTPLAKELGLSQASAQKMIDLYAKHAIESTNQALTRVREMREGWQTTAKALPEIGGELGPTGKVNVAVSRMIDSLGDAKLASDFRAAMNLTGAGDHPAFIQVMYKLAQQLGEGSFVKGNGASPFGQKAPGQATRPTAAQALYPNLP